MAGGWICQAYIHVHSEDSHSPRKGGRQTKGDPWEQETLRLGSSPTTSGPGTTVNIACLGCTVLTWKMD